MFQKKATTQPGQVSLPICTLISSLVGGAGADPPTNEMRAFFLMPLALSVPTLNKKYHRTRAVETFKLWQILKVYTARVR